MVQTPSEINTHLKHLLACDAYKLSHRLMYPNDTTNLYSCLTARGGRGGFPNFVWNHEFAKKIILEVFGNFCDSVLAVQNDPGLAQALTDKVTTVFGDPQFGLEFTQHICYLANFLKQHHQLPLTVKIHQSSEGLAFRTPLVTITGSDQMVPELVWLVNYFETVLLENIWLYQTTLTVAQSLKLLLERYANETADNTEFTHFQCHDFSMRGMSSLQSALYVANAHLQYFSGSDTILGGVAAKSILASEHSVMCADGQEGELNTFKRLLEQFPNKNLSLVIDSYDMWHVLDNILPQLKDLVLQRQEKLYLRPDSGNFETLICQGKRFNPEDKTTWGVIDYLDYHFGSTVNQKGYKVLNEKLGIVYGDGITYERIEYILEQLKQRGFCSSNIVFGVGSTTYQNLNRDTLGFVYKLTAIKKGNTWHDVTKSPITDPTKQSIGGRFDNPNLIQVYG